MSIENKSDVSVDGAYCSRCNTISALTSMVQDPEDRGYPLLAKHGNVYLLKADQPCAVCKLRKEEKHTRER
eukprot:5859341-Amphidinium_carterae.1